MKRAGVAALFLVLGLTASGQAIGSGGLDGVAPLGACIEAALEHSAALAVSGSRLSAADDALRAAESRRLPRVDLQASASWLSNPPEGITIRRGELGYAPTYGSAMPSSVPDRDYVLVEDPEETYFRLVTTLQQPIFSWGRIEAGVRAAEAERNISAVQLEGGRRELARDVRLAWYGRLFAESCLPLLEETVTVLQQAVDDQDGNFREGLVPYLDVLDALANLAEARSRLVEAREGAATARASLVYLCGFDPFDRSGIEQAAAGVSGSGDSLSGRGASGSPSAPARFRDAFPALDEAALLALALRDSPDLAVLAGRLEQAEANVRATEGGGMLRPSIGLNVSLEITGGRIPFLAANWTDDWSTNLIVSIGTQTSLFDGFQSRHETDGARELALQARLGIEGLTGGLEVQVRRAVEDARRAWASVELEESRRDLAVERHRNAASAAENELATRAEERGARALALGSELSLLAARFTVESKLITLQYLCGEDCGID